MKISFITTVLNEEKTIKNLLGSLSIQSKFPNEIVIVDGGSTDATASEISNFIHSASSGQISNKKIKFKFIIKKGNRSVGRNEAIKNSTGSIIVCTDGGCILDKNWVKNISKPFENSDVDVVAGYYKPIIKNIFQKCLAAYTCIMPDRLDKDNFLPSSRSIAFKKSAWKEVGGYPKYLDTCEDLVFARKMKEKEFEFKTSDNAIVYWPQRKNILDAFNQFFRYAMGDGMAGYFRPQTPLLFLRYILGFILLLFAIFSTSKLILYIIILLFILYFVWSIVKNYRYVNNWRAFIVLPVLQITSDIAVILGTLVGILKSI